jgi:hypothetical protein
MTTLDSVQTPIAPLIDPPVVDNPKRLGVLELLLVAIGLSLLMGAEIAANKPRLIFDGPFILDERLTDLIVRDPSISHSIYAVKHGVDTNPPIYHLILRGFWMAVHPLFHDDPRIALRAFSTLCTFLALIGTYALLRRAFGPLVSFVAVLAVWAHPEVVVQSFNARFYPPLLLATVLMCLALQIRGSGVIRAILVALAAMLLCTLHYFGILILGPIALASLVVDDGPLLRRFGRVLPTIAGPLALLPFIPFIKSQAEGLSVKTWVDPFSFVLARTFLTDTLCAVPLLLVVAVWTIGKLIQDPAAPADPIDRKTVRAATLPVLSLVAVPLVIIAFSAVVQSALIDRYAISAALVLAPVVALLGQSLSRTMLLVLAIFLSGFTVLQLHSVTSTRAGDLGELTAYRDEMLSDNLPIVFADRADAVRLAAFDPDLFPRIQLVDQREAGVTLSNFRRYEIDMIGKMNAIYPLPALVTPAQMGGGGPFHFYGKDFDLATVCLEQPMRHVKGDVYEIAK